MEYSYARSGSGYFPYLFRVVRTLTEKGRSATILEALLIPSTVFDVFLYQMMGICLCAVERQSLSERGWHRATRFPKRRIK
jgi:hypothetical protein